MTPKPTNAEATPPPRGPVAADALLHPLADQLATRLAEDLEPALVHVADEGRGQVRLGLLPLEGRHPSELLVGFTAPPDWHALGMATSGFAYPIAERGAPRRARTRIHVVALLSRSGELARQVRLPGGERAAANLGIPIERLSADEELTGEQVDLLRLALDLDTDPAPCGSHVFWAIEWLSALAGCEPAQLVSWNDIIEHHPAMALLRRNAPGSVTEDADLVAVAGAFARVCTWTRLRSLVAEGRFEVPELAPADARWFDDGGFARFVLSRCPPLTMVRGQACDQLSPPLAHRLLATLDELGVPGSSWPDAGSAAP
jgi:hypothetical protein